MIAKSTFLFALVLWTLHASAQAQAIDPVFKDQVKPFLQQYCQRCHHVDKPVSGVRVDHLEPGFADGQLKSWQGILHQIATGAMPPEGARQPTAEERKRVAAWLNQGVAQARLRPTPRNGSARRLTTAQYRNTLRELLLIEDNLADTLPPDAVSRDGFVNNQETLNLSPLLLEAYYDIAEQALERCIVDPQAKPTIQNFRMDLGTAINPVPIADNLILGADSLLLKNADFTVTELKAKKPFAFNPFILRTRYRFIEGYQGNDTVRGWRDYDSINHAVFACMRGTNGYPKGQAFGTVPEGLLLRPAIPSIELFGVESTYGPRANFKIALRELPDFGRFRVTVTAAKYDDGLLLDSGARPAQAAGSITRAGPGQQQMVEIPKAGVYQVDLHARGDFQPPKPDASRLNQGLIGHWALDGDVVGKPDVMKLTGKLMGDARFVDSPFGKALSLDGYDDAVMVPHRESMHVGDGDFSVSAWIHPRELRQAGIVCLGKYGWTHGWYFDMPNGDGVLRIETAGPKNQSNGTVASAPGTLRVNQWQHVTAVVSRTAGTRLFVNGYRVAQGKIGPANLDNPKVDLQIGRIQDAHQFKGEIFGVRIHRRALDESEIQALVEPGRRFASPPAEKASEVNLALGNRQFSGTLVQPAFLVVRLAAGPLQVKATRAGSTPLEKITFTPLAEDEEMARRFVSFEKRNPKLGVHLGLRRDCGSTLSPVGVPQTVGSGGLTRFVFEGAIRNHPSPEVERDNVNYLAGVREIGVRSEFTDGRDMPRLLIRAVEFEGPFYDTWPPPTHRNLFGDTETDTTDKRARALIHQFASRAFRRPVTAAEEATLFAVHDKARAGGTGFHAAVRDALQVVLTSPQYVFLIENSSSPQGEPLDGYELASKLAYFLWNSPPDAALLRLAADGKLAGQLDAEVGRMMADPRFERFVSEFVEQWLALDKFTVLEPDRNRFPRLTPHARAQLFQEPAAFVRHLARNNLPTRNLVDSDFILANEVVAAYYGMADKTESGFGFVPIRHGRPGMGGLLTQPAILAGLSDGRESNPVKRGAWVARKIIAEPPDDPPPNVPTLKEETKGLSLRERLSRHRNQPGCAGCHSKVDPWGVPLEEFDAGGLLKMVRVDSRSTLPDGRDVADFNALRKYLAEDRIDQVAFSLLKNLTIYATGRSLGFSEQESLRRQGAPLKATGYRVGDMIRLVVNSPHFLEK